MSRALAGGLLLSMTVPRRIVASQIEAIDNYPVLADADQFSKSSFGRYQQNSEAQTVDLPLSAWHQFRFGSVLIRKDEVFDPRAATGDYGSRAAMRVATGIDVQ